MPSVLYGVKKEAEMPEYDETGARYRPPEQKKDPVAKLVAPLIAITVLIALAILVANIGLIS